MSKTSVVKSILVCYVFLSAEGCGEDTSAKGEDCDDDDSRCRENMVQTCANGTWEDYDDCEAQGKTCTIIKGQADCVDKESIDGGDGSDTDSDMDSDTDNDTDSDSDIDIDTDTDTDIDMDADADADYDATCPPMTDCAGGKYDSRTGLCWQDPPGNKEMNWYEATGTADPDYNPGGAVDYCGDLELGGHKDWRLPDIDELISLVRGCVQGTATGTLSPSTCGLNNPDCLDVFCCEGPHCVTCPYDEGPGTGGCYRDSALSGDCDMFWSSSTNISAQTYSWGVDFSDCYMDNVNKTNDNKAYCVRNGQ